MYNIIYDHKKLSSHKTFPSIQRSATPQRMQVWVKKFLNVAQIFINQGIVGRSILNSS